jgi:hypothetical protein
MVKTLKELGIEGVNLNIIGAIFNKPIASIVEIRRKLKQFSLKLTIRQGCQLPPLLLNIVLDLLTRAIKQKKVLLGIQVGKN